MEGLSKEVKLSKLNIRKDFSLINAKAYADKMIHFAKLEIHKVYFRKFKSGDVIAIFPDDEWDRDGNVMSYMHVGQHAGCDNACIDLEVANESEYESLKMELESIGYNLEIL